MPKFRRKPLIFHADQWLPGVNDEIILWGVARDGGYEFPAAYIATLEGQMRVMPGDWIITGVKGEKWACKRDVFEATYEPTE